MSPRTLVTGGSGFLGTNLVAKLLESGREVLNVSRTPPRCSDHRPIFWQADVLDVGALNRVVRRFGPTEVVHLAAETDFVETHDLRGFEINTQGTRNIVDAVTREAGEARLLYASSNVVDRIAEASSGREERQPDHRYAASKLVAEGIVRYESPAAGTWCIVRPCYVWGPWFGEPFRDFFLAVARGRYLHLGSVDRPKLLGYVGNVTFEILRLLDAPRDRVHGKTFYLADYNPTTIRHWADLIAVRMGAARPRTLPEPLVGVAARAGDLLKAVGLRNPALTTTRLSNMRKDTTGAPIEPTREVVGPIPYSLEAGVEETLSWLRLQGGIA